DRRLCVALGLIFAGTLGNLYDRLFFGGVRDFLHWYYLVDWPVFNLADCCLVVGAGLLLLQAFQSPPTADEAPGESHVSVPAGARSPVASFGSSPETLLFLRSIRAPPRTAPVPSGRSGTLLAICDPPLRAECSRPKGSRRRPAARATARGGKVPALA